jgi:hypothetical protein
VNLTDTDWARLRDLQQGQDFLNTFAIVMLALVLVLIVGWQLQHARTKAAARREEEAYRQGYAAGQQDQQP